MKLRYKLLLMVAVVPMALAAQTKKWDAYRAENGISLPTWAVKTNLLADLTLSPNLGVELKTGGKTSFELVGQWNPFAFRNGVTKWKHIGVQPEFRYWFKESFRNHFVGLQATYAFYNVGGLPNGPFSDYMHNNRFQGDLYGAGISWGYRWNWAKHWGLEVTAAVGYLHKDQKRYECVTCGKDYGDASHGYFGPTEIGVNLIFGGGGKTVPVATPAPAPTPVVKQEVYTPTLAPSFIFPAAEPVKVRYESGSAYLEFPVGNATINPTFRNNAAELAKIDDSVNKLKADPDAKLTGVSLIGHASPEGSYASNQALSQRRAEALRTYVNKLHSFPAGVVSATGAGEDWATLSTLVGESSIAGRNALLEVIDGSADYDARDRAMIAANNAAYKEMVSSIYPRLRRTDYKLDYEVAPISIERGKEVMRTNPKNLSLNELWLIAETYKPGSNEYKEVSEIAARTFPDSDVANNNAAAVALQRGELATAAAYLAKVKNTNDGDYNNNMGVLAFLQGDAAKAVSFFRAAGSKAAANAGELEKHLRSIQ